MFGMGLVAWNSGRFAGRNSGTVFLLYFFVVRGGVLLKNEKTKMYRIYIQHLQTSNARIWQEQTKKTCDVSLLVHFFVMTIGQKSRNDQKCRLAYEVLQGTFSGHFWLDDASWTIILLCIIGMI